MDHSPHNWIMDYILMPLLVSVHFVFGLLPTIALIVPVVWYCVQIYESKTFKAVLEWAKTLKSRLKG